MALRILDLGTRLKCVDSFTPRPLYPQGKSSWYPLDRRLGGPQSRSGRGEELHIHLLSGLEPPIIHPARKKVKVKLSLYLTKHHAMKAYWRSGGISVRIFLPRH
jgi:hypothetical protein